MAATPGPGVDRQGNPVVDPTENVIALNEAANRRQDDLRAAESKHLRDLLDAQTVLHQADMAHTREVLALREQLFELRERYDEKLRVAEQSRTDALRAAEADRINAIRRVDVEATATTAQVQETRATALANTVAQSAEAVRIAQAAATQASQEALTRVFAPLQTAIEDLRRAQYQTQGEKQQVETRQGASSLSVSIVAAVTGFLFLVLTVVDIFLTLKK